MSQILSVVNDFPFIVLVDEKYWFLDFLLTVLYDKREITQEFENIDAQYQAGNVEKETAMAIMEPLLSDNPLLEFAMNLYYYPEEPIKITRLLRVDLITFLNAWPHKKNVQIKKFLWRFASTMAENYAISHHKYDDIMLERLSRPNIKRSIVLRKEWESGLLTDDRHYMVMKKSVTNKYFHEVKLAFWEEPKTFLNFLEILSSFHLAKDENKVAFNFATEPTVKLLCELLQDNIVLLVSFGNFLPHFKEVASEAYSEYVFFKKYGKPLEENNEAEDLTPQLSEQSTEI